MSSLSRPYYSLFAAFIGILQFFTIASGQDIAATIQVREQEPSIAHISGTFATPTRNLSLLRSFSGFSGLGERVRNLLLSNDGKPVSHQSTVAGEYVADAPFTGWSYSIDLKPRPEHSAAAHVSWLTSDGGLLMFADLLPVLVDGKSPSAKVRISLPPGWRQSENGRDGALITNDANGEVLAVGKNLRFRTVQAGTTTITIGIDGEWLFSSDEIANFAQQIYTRATEVFGAPAAKEVFIKLLRFPKVLPAGQWQAETRGKNVIIISSDMPFKTQSLQRLHEQLRHEILHLWIPNAVNLSGNYDWFYEGFALYASLKIAVSENRIRFEDFLDTLSRAYAIDARQANRISLVELSRERWNGNETNLYARGMFVAFLFDIALLNNSKTKRSVNDILREVYAKHKFPSPRTEGTQGVLEIMRSQPELRPLIDKYISGAGRFEAAGELNYAGLELSNGLRVLSKLSGKQKDLLDALGYNNWRRLSPGPIK